MTISNRIGPSLGLAAVLALGACATPSPPPTASPPSPVYYPPATQQGSVYYPPATQPGATYSGYGTVQSITPVKQDYQGVGGSGYGLGTVAGAVIGGVAGHQVGKGKGNTAATVAGTAGGAYIGHQLEKRNQAPDSYAIAVRMDNGAYQTMTQTTTGGFVVGDRVRISNGFMQRN